MFTRFITAFKARFSPKKTVASVMAPLTRIQSALKEVHATAQADVTAVHAEIDRALAEADAHYNTLDAAAQHLRNLSDILAPPSSPAQAVANLTGSTVTVVTPVAVAPAAPLSGAEIQKSAFGCNPSVAGAAR